MRLWMIRRGVEDQCPVGMYGYQKAGHMCELVN